MTHDELMYAHPTPTYGVVRCQGTVVFWEGLPDPDPLRPGAGPTAVEVWECAGCGARVVLDATAGRVRNQYVPVPPVDDPRDLPGVLARMAGRVRPGVAGPGQVAPETPDPADVDLSGGILGPGGRADPPRLVPAVSPG